jgi:hypothetical protein
LKELGAFAILFVIFGVSDFISNKTKSIVSMLFASSIILLVGFWVGLPKTIFVDSALLPIGTLLMSLLIVHMGSLMSVRELARQWKTVVISIAAIVGVFVGVFLIGSLIIGKQYAAAAAPPISGGVVASIMMSEAAKKAGLDSIAVFAILLCVVQGFVGYPVASLCLKKEGKRLAKLYDPKAAISASESASETRSRIAFIPELPKSLQTSNILLAKLALVALLSFWLAGLTKGTINKYVICLVAGVFFTEIGLLERNGLNKANAFGISMAALLVVVFASLTKATPEMVLSLLKPMLISLALGVAGIALLCVPVGKLIGVSWEMALAVGATALFGFPGTYIISQEVSESVSGGNEAEKKYIMDQIFPKMLVGGFVTVTICSVVFAGIMVKYIG